MGGDVDHSRSTPRDLNQLITDWVGTGHWIPESPYKPIGLLGKILASHGNPAERPAALDEAREQAELLAVRQRIDAQIENRETQRRAREAGRAALQGPGHRAARAILDEIAQRRKGRGSGAAATP